MSKFFITTAIDYPNALPHIGTAFEKIGADVQARYRRFIGNEVCFLMGNDENTLKVAARARTLELDPRTYCMNMAQEFQRVWHHLNISHTDFIQTVEKRHYKAVAKFINAVNAAGYIYKKKYTGLYCDGCEAFKTEKEVSEGRCPDHKHMDLRQVEEENYFFRLSAFRERLLEMYANDSITIRPLTRRNEVVKFVESDLHDISISRNNTGWGIPIPWDDSQVVYVWFDALINYISGIGYASEYPLDAEYFQANWPADVHVIGKDIIRFHCALWPAMVMAHNESSDEKLALPHNVFAHGFVHSEGAKVSKSGTRIDPMELIRVYGCDAYRYFFLAKCDFGTDSDFSLKRFDEVYHTDLANTFGNLVSRVVSMSLKYCDGNLDQIERWKFSMHVIGDHYQDTEQFQYRNALTTVMRLLQDANHFVEEAQPWKSVRQDVASCCRALHRTAHLLRVIALMLKPYLPATAEKVYNTFVGSVPFKDADSKYLCDLAVDRVEPITINKALLVDGNYPPLFPRIVGGIKEE